MLCLDCANGRHSQGLGAVRVDRSRLDFNECFEHVDTRCFLCVFSFSELSIEKTLSLVLLLIPRHSCGGKFSGPFYPHFLFRASCLFHCFSPQDCFGACFLLLIRENTACYTCGASGHGSIFFTARQQLPCQLSQIFERVLTLILIVVPE